jgi:hypothetical protein
VSEYFRDVPDPHRLIAPERAPITGRRVPKHRSKRSQRSSQPSGLHAARPWMLTGAAVVAVTGVLIGVVAASDDGPSIKDSAPTASTQGVSPTTSAVVVVTAATVEPTDPTAAAVESTLPETTVAPTTTAPETTTTVAVPLVTRLVATASATAAEVIPSDPAASAEFSGPLPVFTIPFDCSDSSCVLSIRDFFPGAVTADGLTTAPVVGDTVSVTTTSASTCTGSDGTQYTRQHTSTIDLVLSGVQDVGGIALPAAIAGTLTSMMPDAGYVPRVGDVVDRGAPTGCPGQTLIFTVGGPISAG